MKFDLVATNPPFQDSGRRGKTPHKLWIEFTKAAFETWLKDGGYLAQVSPSSFRSPNSDVLEIMKKKQTLRVNFDSGRFFPGVGSTFADYVIQNLDKPRGFRTILSAQGIETSIRLDASLLYLPNRLEQEAIDIHTKVVFASRKRLAVEWDYVTCHNIRLNRSTILSKVETSQHPFPVLHTNRQIWWSSVQQEFAPLLKVMWSRSGYTKPFFDNGSLGGTDMVYFVRVESRSEGLRLEKILNSRLFQYVFRTAKWSGFGNERVFRHLPAVDIGGAVSDEKIYDFFDLSIKERAHVAAVVA